MPFRRIGMFTQEDHCRNVPSDADTGTDAGAVHEYRHQR